MTTHLIAGLHAGIGVRPSGSTIAGRFTALKEAAEKQGNFWALTAVKTIESLSSGHIKPCVYVSESMRNKFVYFEVKMPGCTASVMKTSKGEYLLIALKADGDYSALQKVGKKPAYYEAKEGIKNRWKANFIPKGKVSKEGFPVAITDRYISADIAANSSATYVKSAPNVSVTRGFGMHYTPGEIKIGGLKNIQQAMNAATDTSLTESAMILARTMSEARHLEGITWVPERGGSGVATQAMYLLKAQGVNFKGSKHQMFFSGITTDALTAENLAREIGMDFERKTKSIDPFNLDQLIGSGVMYGGTFIAAVNRFQQDPEHTALKLGTDVVSGAMGGRSAVGKVVAVTKAVSLASGTAAAVTGTAPMIGIALALASLAPSMFKGFFPDQYHKFKDKF